MKVALIIIILKLTLMSSLSTLPKIIYGTAWKKEKTTALVIQAIKMGFRAIDTACQPKHYEEKLVGDGLVTLYDEGFISRGDIWLQTKFTPLSGQDPDRLPYSIDSSLPDQVHESIQKSLQNLQTDYIDSLLLHSPLRNFEDTMAVWRIFEQSYNEGIVRSIGLSNTYDLSILQRIYNSAIVKPSYLQNRFYSKTNYDIDIRKFCDSHGIIYQSFWTLTANPRVLNSVPIRQISSKYNKTPAQIFFNYLMHIGIHPLTGTTSELHMIDDLNSINVRLSDSELDSISHELV